MTGQAFAGVLCPRFAGEDLLGGKGNADQPGAGMRAKDGRDRAAGEPGASKTLVEQLVQHGCAFRVVSVGYLHPQCAAGRVPLGNLQYGAGYGAVDLVDASLAPGDPAGHSYFTHSYEMARDMMWALAGTPTAMRAAKDGPAGQTLTCSDWEESRCAAGDGRYVLAVTPERAERGPRPIRTVWPFILFFR